MSDFIQRRLVTGGVCLIFAAVNTVTANPAAGVEVLLRFAGYRYGVRV